MFFCFSELIGRTEQELKKFMKIREIGGFLKPNENLIETTHYMRNDELSRLMVSNLKFIKKSRRNEA